jgi:hypothetical protein
MKKMNPYQDTTVYTKYNLILLSQELVDETTSLARWINIHKDYERLQDLKKIRAKLEQVLNALGLRL